MTIVNRVAESGIITLNLEDFYPSPDNCVVFDLKNFLFRELILKEKDFREALKQHDWTQYAQKHVAIICSTDAVIQLWAYMLVTGYLQAHAATIVAAPMQVLQDTLWLRNLSAIDTEQYRDKRVVIKGCGDKPVPPIAYAEISRLLRPVVKSLMYGEPCSTVPIYKN